MQFKMPDKLQGPAPDLCYPCLRAYWPQHLADDSRCEYPGQRSAAQPACTHHNLGASAPGQSCTAVAP
jgi:hypothetical protein